MVASSSSSDSCSVTRSCECGAWACMPGPRLYISSWCVLMVFSMFFCVAAWLRQDLDRLTPEQNALVSWTVMLLFGSCGDNAEETLRRRIRFSTWICLSTELQAFRSRLHGGQVSGCVALVTALGACTLSAAGGLVSSCRDTSSQTSQLTECTAENCLII